jgi:putative flavoprotein involved in K+ transport
MFTALDGDRVHWSDGNSERVDAVILATGYRPGLEYLRPVGALDHEGRPLHARGVSTTVPGLGYVGLPHQRSIASATLRGAGPDAAYVIDQLLRVRETDRLVRPAGRVGRMPASVRALRAACCT